MILDLRGPTSKGKEEGNGEEERDRREGEKRGKEGERGGQGKGERERRGNGRGLHAPYLFSEILNTAPSSPYTGIDRLSKSLHHCMAYISTCGNIDVGDGEIRVSPPQKIGRTIFGHLGLSCKISFAQIS